MTTAEKLYTAEEFLTLPEDPSGGKMELVEGKVCVMPPVGDWHGEQQIELAVPLREFARRHDLGIVRVETGYRLEPGNVRAPDVSFVEKERLDPARDRSSFIAGPPTLAIEVVTNDDRAAHLLRKVGEYLDAGARRVWAVRHAGATVTVFTDDGETRTLHRGDILTSDDAGFVVEGFALPLDQLFS
ncbi:MAG: Uma2 family endonuclease [Anaerolinea sp.]|nr:Uma2 family endonuclease [Anaerolinea sp.]